MYTILVADDDEDLFEALNFTLSQNDYKVIQAKDGAEAISKALELQPDLILLDIIMPNVDGLTACRKIKTTEETKDIPTIMLTAKDGVKDVAVAFQAGADDYIVKPFIMGQVLGKVKEFLGRKAKQEKESDL